MDQCAFCETCPFDHRAQQINTFFEIHVTVNTTEIERFREVCLRNRIKPIVIEFQNYLDGETETQVMTSQQVRGVYENMKVELEFIVNMLEKEGFEVVRRKVEAMPAFALYVEGCYFEAHLQFKLEKKWVNKLRREAAVVDLHISNNAFKMDGEIVTMMGTYREYSRDPESFLTKVDMIRDTMIGEGFSVGKVISEYCILDDKVELDGSWIKQ